MFKVIIKRNLIHVQNILNFTLHKISPRIGRRLYTTMQKRVYAKKTKNLREAQDLCVGNFIDHERYPYEDYLLKNYSGNFNRALDFGCGVGRMMLRMFKHFDFIDGVDISADNLSHAENYLTKNGVPKERFNLFLSDGQSSCSNVGVKYDFVYSTIVIQHIAVHSIRMKILADIFNQLNSDGVASIQFGFGWDNGTYWKSNFYGALSTNGDHDFTVPTNDHLSEIKADMISLGYREVTFDIYPSPHPDKKNYHPFWVFMTLKK